MTRKLFVRHAAAQEVGKVLIPVLVDPRRVVALVWVEMLFVLVLQQSDCNGGLANRPKAFVLFENSSIENGSALRSAVLNTFTSSLLKPNCPRTDRTT